MKKVLLALALVLGTVAAASAAEVISGCYKKANGQFRIVVPPKKCLPSEKAVALLGAATVVATAPAVGTPNPLVYDANDQFLGVGQAGDLYIPSLRMWATINLTDVSGDLWSGQLYYQSADCSGQPHSEYAYLHRVFGNGQHEGRRHYTAAPELEGYIAIGSLADGAGNCQALDFDYSTVMSKAVPVDLPFTVPVALPTKLVNP